MLARKEDLVQVFGTDDEMRICLVILSEGELQVSDRERKVELDSLFRDVASIISEKCINPSNNRPYPLTVIERALKEAHFSIDPKRAAKAQALEALSILQTRFPIERARMRLQIRTNLSNMAELAQLLGEKKATIEEEELIDDMVQLVTLVDPGMFRELHAFVHSGGAGGRLEVLSLSASGEEMHDAGEPMISAMKISEEVKPLPKMSSNTGFVPAVASNAGVVPPRRAHVVEKGIEIGRVVYKGPLSGLGEEHSSRRERFAELDNLQPGWTVELRGREEGGVLDAVFYSPEGTKVGPFSNARRQALAASKK